MKIILRLLFIVSLAPISQLLIGISAPIYVFDAKKHPENFYLSNYYLAPVSLSVGDKLYNFKTAKAAYQAGKFIPPFAAKVDELMLARLEQARDGYEAAKIGGDDSKEWLQPDQEWNSPAIKWMLFVVTEKFKQNPELKAKLLATGNSYIIEDCIDPFWGGACPEGKNWFGLVLMKVRDDLRK